MRVKRSIFLRFWTNLVYHKRHFPPPGNTAVFQDRPTQEIFPAPILMSLTSDGMAKVEKTGERHSRAPAALGSASPECYWKGFSSGVLLYLTHLARFGFMSCVNLAES